MISPLIKKILLLGFIVTIAFSGVSCSYSEYKEKEFLNIDYKDGLTLDIYQPTSRLYSKNPVVIFFHGGGWISGDKNEINTMFLPVITALRQNGITVISANYSLLDESKSKNYSDCVSDAADCADWVFENAEKYDLDTSNVCVMGYSAGAYLALMTSYYDRDDIFAGKYENISKGKIKLCVDISGPVAFTEEYDDNYSSQILDSYSKYLFDPESESYYDDLYDSSVLNNIDKTDSGTRLLIYRGGDDDIISETHSTELYNTASIYNFDVQYISFAGINHFFEMTEKLYEPVYTLSDVYEKISSDIIGILKK